MKSQESSKFSHFMLIDDGIYDVKNLDKLLPEEKEQIQELYEKWETARSAKLWDEADKLRSMLIMWNRDIINDKIWHPFFEHNINRQRRAAKRIQKYGVSVSPWELLDASRTD